MRLMSDIQKCYRYAIRLQLVLMYQTQSMDVSEDVSELLRSWEVVVHFFREKKRCFKVVIGIPS